MKVTAIVITLAVLLGLVQERSITSCDPSYALQWWHFVVAAVIGIVMVVLPFSAIYAFVEASRGKSMANIMGFIGAFNLGISLQPLFSESMPVCPLRAEVGFGSLCAVATAIWLVYQLQTSQPNNSLNADGPEGPQR